MADISIILVTYNSKDYIELCLDSIFAQGFKDYEVVVIDNGSEDDTPSIIKDKYREVILIENARNLGVCKARNQGILKAIGEFVLCLDPDVTLREDFLEKGYEAIKSDSNVGVVQPKILMEGGKTIYSSGIYRSWLWRFYDIGSGKIDNDKDYQRYIFGACAAAAFYRREALEAIRHYGEYFDEDFFYFFEDADVSWRLQHSRWRVLYAPDAVCTHSAGRSRKKDKVSQYLCLRNRCLVLIKNEPFLGLLKAPLVFLTYDLWRDLFMLITNPGYFIQASREIIRLTPRMLQKRCR